LSTPDGIRIWRLVKAGRTHSAWDGEGAFRFGGRWNSRGVRAVYASSSLALALLETLVHLDPALPLPAMCAQVVGSGTTTSDHVVPMRTSSMLTRLSQLEAIFRDFLASVSRRAA